MKRLLLAAVVAVVAVSFTSGLQAQTTSTPTKKQMTGSPKQPRNMPRAGAGCTSRHAQMIGRTC
jgi:hypothetical protein